MNRNEGPFKPPPFSAHVATRPRGLLLWLARVQSAGLWLYFVVFLVHLFGRHSDYTAFQGTLAGLCAVVTLSTVLPLFRTDREDLPVLAWVYAQFYVFWVVPIFLEGETTRVATFSMLQNTQAVTLAWFAVLVFLGVVLLCARSVARFLPARKAVATSRPGSEALILFLGVVSLAVSYRVIWSEGQVAAYVYILSVLFSPALFLLFIIYERNTFRVSRWFNTGYYLYVAGAVGVGLLSGRLEFALLPFAVVILTDVGQAKRVRVGYVLLFLALLVVVQPAKFYYRDMTGFRTRYYEQISIAEGFRILSSSLEQSWGGGGRDDYSENLEGLAERLNELTKIGAVFYTVPKLVDFDGGKTWKPILHGFVPRLFWKDKPATKVITNDYFNIKLGFQDSMETLDTTASMPLIAEAYFNAGWFGVVGVAALCGLAFGLLSWAFQSNSRLWYVGVFFIVVDLRSTEGLAALVSSVWKTFLFALFWLAVLRVVSGLRRQRQARALP